MENRRQFTRILFSIKATLYIEEQLQEIAYPVSIHDISLNGALVTAPKCNTPLKAKLGRLVFNLGDSDALVEMHIGVVHQEPDVIGLQCNAIDIDSVTYLRRLVELNLGDQSQLEKELSQLSKSQP
ncbi:PilZ domain-containing protein [Thalassotalea euphylliae]|uniref:Cyclic diguanosine monophosphate-binding protein n=1 Tax=Thalassotalea euphylliae TaxID=1655234 RepID=A0A3E0TTS8_9GAMM|nr:PilZ domain-containing protein [Thalassotalea euphylliae]REL27879.1 PilZ domain-containing protein [Thalassotalea euphylliae]